MVRARKRGPAPALFDPLWSPTAGWKSNRYVRDFEPQITSECLTFVPAPSSWMGLPALATTRGAALMRLCRFRRQERIHLGVYDETQIRKSAGGHERSHLLPFLL